MQVLVTGATGLVGSQTVRALQTGRHRVRVFVRDSGKAHRVFGSDATVEVSVGDVTDPAAVADALRGVDAVVHCAAIVSMSPRRAEEILETNLRAVELVVGGAADRGIGSIIYISSVAALFEPGLSADVNRLPGAPEGAYARSKADAERFVRRLHDHGAPVCTLYPPAVIGPDDPGLSEGNHGLRAMLSLLALDTTSGFEAVDARDLAAVIAAFVANGQRGRHVVSGRYLPWPELIELFDELTGRRIRRLRISGRVLRAAGCAADRIKRVIPFDFPLSSESARYATQWHPTVPSPAAHAVELRAARETYTDTIEWLCRTGYLTSAQGGRLGNEI